MRDGAAIVESLATAPGQEPRGGGRGAVDCEKRGPGREQLVGEHEEAAWVGVDLDSGDGSALSRGVPLAVGQGQVEGLGLAFPDIGGQACVNYGLSLHWFTQVCSWQTFLLFFEKVCKLFWQGSKLF